MIRSILALSSASQWHLYLYDADNFRVAALRALYIVRCLKKVKQFEVLGPELSSDIDLTEVPENKPIVPSHFRLAASSGLVLCIKTLVTSSSIFSILALNSR